MVEKKLTSNTCRQASIEDCSVSSRSPFAPLGEMAALLTRACSLPSGSRERISATARAVSAGSARSTWIWSSGPAAQGQFSGKAWREQVITRQPALEKRFTVAWPMPREAPVRIRVRFSSSIWLGVLVSAMS